MGGVGWSGSIERQRSTNVGGGGGMGGGRVE